MTGLQAPPSALPGQVLMMEKTYAIESIGRQYISAFSGLRRYVEAEE